MKEHCVAVTQIMWDSSTRKLKDICDSPHMEELCDIDPKEREYG